MLEASPVPGDFQDPSTLQGKGDRGNWYFCEQQVQGAWVFWSEFEYSTIM